MIARSLCVTCALVMAPTAEALACTWTSGFGLSQQSGHESDAFDSSWNGVPGCWGGTLDHYLAELSN